MLGSSGLDFHPGFASRGLDGIHNLSQLHQQRVIIVVLHRIVVKIQMENAYNRAGHIVKSRFLLISRIDAWSHRSSHGFLSTPCTCCFSVLITGHLLEEDGEELRAT